MELFWKIWAGIAVSILLIALLIELNGGRSGFRGANGLFLFASGYLTLLSSPIPFIVTWIGADLWTAVKVCILGGMIYAALFMLAVKVLERVARTTRR